MKLNPLEFDQNHLWHPYSQFANNKANHHIVKAQGCWLYDATGKRYFDSTSSWWSKAYGHHNLELNQAIIEQLDSLSHVMFAGIVHPSAISLAQELLPLLPHNLDVFFYSDSGSVAVEVALKLGLQYQAALAQQQNKNFTKKRFISLQGDYHGDTWHCMSLSDPEQMHAQFHQQCLEIMPQHHFISCPPAWQGEDLEQDLDYYDCDSYRELKSLLETSADQFAGLIIEPMLQGANGMKVYHPSYLKGLIELAQQYQLLVIFDEIATGFARCNKTFVLDYLPASLQPDILLLGKALTGGYLGLGLTIVQRQVAQQISKYYPALHGPTFMANPLACAVATQAVKIYKRLVNPQLLAALTHQLNNIKLISSPLIKEVRCLGPIAVVEFKQPLTPQQITLIREQGFNHELMLRPFANIVYLLVSYTISNQELELVVNNFITSLQLVLQDPQFINSAVVETSYV